MADIKELLTRKIGPLPTYVYLAGAGVAVLFLLTRKKTATPSPVQPSPQSVPYLGDTSGGGGSFGGGSSYGGTNTTSYVCADGSTVSDPSQCPKQPAPVVIPPPQNPTPQFQPSGYFGSYPAQPTQGTPITWPNGAVYGSIAPGTPTYIDANGNVFAPPGSVRVSNPGNPFTSNAPSQSAINTFNSPQTQGFLASQGYNGATLTQQQAQNLFNLLGQLR